MKKEKAFLMPLPPTPFELSTWKIATVVKAILGGYKVEQQGYKACMGLLKIADYAESGSY